jgi:two-component system LytT family response regulator
MTKIIIIENEPAAAATLKAQLKNNFAEGKVVAACTSIQSSLAAIKKHEPDLVFMDVELDQGETGFDILNKLDNFPFEVIVTTSFDKYAKQACKASALDFLEKPFTDEDLVKAIEKFKKRKRSLLDPKQVELLLEVYYNRDRPIKQFALPHMKGFDLVSTERIIYFEASDKYSVLFLTGEEKLTVTMTLKDCKELLEHSGFFKIHKSYLVNLAHVKSYRKGQDGTVLMSNNKELTVSRERTEAFIKLIGPR